jgi:hypothetical protein
MIAEAKLKENMISTLNTIMVENTFTITSKNPT